ncbi:GntR family transcriptional regulator [Micromonospora sp. WMMD1082]|uniref:GntR family transcriptional regulator n=1 Tax=Micromonospora sp. WMMD1082 TaxID=3016104 RepID=UPI0024169147|nr:GntR family transcriptional regulator [Micromonospora sp. WMMD1082]MDG4796393.1 GntR family transcriptional regulator [Micromonospora sp. WMMD1082]
MPTPRYGQPRYRVIADELRKRIESGAIPSGALLPTESAIAAEFHVARGTIRKAIAALREEGQVATEQGRGTYVAQHRQTPSEVRQREIPADVRLAALFQVEVGTLLIEQEKVIRQVDRVGEVALIYHVDLAST